MTINFHDPINNDGLFDVQGPQFTAQKAIKAQCGQVLHQLMLDGITRHQLQTVTEPIELAGQVLPDGPPAIVAAADGPTGILQNYLVDILIQIVAADRALPSETLEEALVELIKQMTENSETVKGSTSTVTVSSNPNNRGSGDAILAAADTNRSGQNLQYAIPERIIATCTLEGAPGSWSVSSSPSVPLLNAQYPQGSDAALSVSPATSTEGLLSNGGLETWDADDVPSNWSILAGAIGTDFQQTTPEVQTVQVSGTPTGGFYQLNYTDRHGKTYTTANIAFDADSGAVSGALNNLTGLGAVTVEEDAGSPPDVTHKITFTGAGGEQVQLTSQSYLTGGTPLITHATTAPAAGPVFRGTYAIHVYGSTMRLSQPVNLLAGSQYALGAWLIDDSVASTGGELTISLTDGSGGSVINDDAGIAQSTVIQLSSVSSASWAHLWGLSPSRQPTFRLPTTPLGQIYLDIELTSPVVGGGVYLDELCLVQMQEPYAGGPPLAMFAGREDNAVLNELWLDVTNDYAGEIQTWYGQNYDMASLDLTLPFLTNGSETIPDTLI
ncbi:hypothetical protein K0U83_22665 [bacterium]|nr:hypothetical protein [bacterium]